MPKRSRRRPSADREAAIEAFGAAADVPGAERSLATPTSKPASSPASSLVRWEHYEDLRDSVAEYARRERYSLQAVLIESIRRGLAEIETTGWAPEPNRGSHERNDITIELKARADRDEDGTWTVEIPELTSKTPSGATIVATGSARTSRELARAAVEVASAWLGVEPAEVAIDVSVDESRP